MKHPERVLLYEISMVIDSNEGIAYITSLWVRKGVRGNRVGSTLLLEAMTMALVHGAHTIQLDDMSDQCRHSSTNIYIQSGMAYVNEMSGCEMTGSTQHCQLLLTRRLCAKPSKFDFAAVMKHRVRSVLGPDDTKMFTYTHGGYEKGGPCLLSANGVSAMELLDTQYFS